MSFDVPAESYGRYMGRYSEPLAIEFMQWIDPQPGQRALDVGCGPGALTVLLAARLGPTAVAAVDPSASFVAAARQLLPDTAVEQASAEELPFPSSTFDLTVAQLVVHFMPDPVAALIELGRVTRPGGTIAACVWDYERERMPLSTFWRAVAELDPAAPSESGLPGTGDGQLVEYFRGAGLRDVRQHELLISVPLTGFDDWWQPFRLGVGPAGQYVQRLDEHEVNLIRARCAELLPTGPFTVDATAWAAIGTV